MPLTTVAWAIPFMPPKQTGSETLSMTTSMANGDETVCDSVKTSGLSPSLSFWLFPRSPAA